VKGGWAVWRRVGICDSWRQSQHCQLSKESASGSFNQWQGSGRLAGWLIRAGWLGGEADCWFVVVIGQFNPHCNCFCAAPLFALIGLLAGLAQKGWRMLSCHTPVPSSLQ